MTLNSDKRQKTKTTNNGILHGASPGYEMCSDAWFQARECATLHDTAAKLAV